MRLIAELRQHGRPTVTVTTQADLARYAAASGSYVIRVAAAINVSPKGTEIPVTSNKTIVGVGTSGQIVGGGFFLGAGTRNVIIRNLTIRDTRMADDDPGDDVYDYDGIQMDTADHVWLDHNLITRMNDGLIDSRRDTTYLTVSWNVLADGNKAFGIGWTANVTARMTIHHNWIHDTGQRNPSTDNVAYAHLYNNHLQNVTGYGNYARGATKMVLENSYFELRHPSWSRPAPPGHDPAAALPDTVARWDGHTDRTTPVLGGRCA
jgi:pectate lyase